MIDFLKYRHICYLTSLVALAAGIFFYVFVGGFRYHIDFAGGTELRLAFEKPIEISALRDGVRSKNWSDATIQSLGHENKQYIVRVGLEEKDVENRFKADIAPLFDDNAMRIDSVEHVGAEAGSEVKWNALKAVIISLILLLLYLAIRMQYAYGVGAVVALAHDLLAALLFILFTQEPISLNVLAAILAMLGYSINDTIVIFSKIKENMIALKGQSPLEIVNISINQTLRRTLLTSFSTLLAVLSLLILGGEALHGFSAVMLVGIIAGTYSSIYIASPVMLAVRSYKLD